MTPFPFVIKGHRHPTETRDASDETLHSFRNLFWVALVGSAAVLSNGCAFISDQVRTLQGRTRSNALEAYQGGDYVAARDKYFDSIECAKDLKFPEDVAVCEDVAAGIQETIRSNLEKARDSISKRGNYVQALVHYRVALKSMDASHPERKKTEEGIRAIQESLASFGSEFEELMVKFKNGLGKKDFSDEVWKEIRGTIERLDYLRIALQKQDERLSAMALAYSRKYFNQKEYEKAYGLVEWADAFAKLSTPLSDEEAQFVAVVRFVHGKKKVEIQNGQNGDAKKVAKPKGAVQPAPKNITPSEPKPAPKPEVAVPEVPAENPEKSEVEERIAKIQKKFISGQVYEALVELNEYVQQKKDSDFRAPGVNQQNEWAKAKDKMVGDFVIEADRLYEAEDGRKALDLYRKIEKLEASNPVVKAKVKERIRILENIIGK